MNSARQLRGLMASRNDQSGSEPAVSPRVRLSRRLITAARDILFVGILIAPVIGLTWLICRDHGRGAEAEAGSGAGSGIIAREQVLYLWLPDTLCELAERPDRIAVLRTHRDFQDALLSRNEGDLWYGLTSRGHQVNGGFADRTVIRHPCQDPAHFEELLAVLARAGGNPPRDPIMDFSTATLRRIPDGMQKREPREVIVELLGVEPAAVDRERP